LNSFSFHQREKYYATSYRNPIADAVAKQCPKIAEEQTSPYAKRLSGDELLNVLCEDSCEKLDKVKHNGRHKNIKSFTNTLNLGLNL
jgi:hypothetical protein